jgi:RNA polymerase sigma-70 factor (ECF subfamily)
VTLSSQSVAELVLAARNGDIRASQALYERFAPAVHGCLLSYVTRSETDDLLQDVFETVLSRLDELRDAAAFPGWLMAVTRNAARQHLRQGGRSHEALSDVETDGCGPELKAEARQVLEVLVSLPPRYREVLVLRLVEGMTGPEIAASTGLTHGTVRVYLHEGMHLLRTSLSNNRITGGA